MAKRKHPEDDTIELDSSVIDESPAAQTEEVQVNGFVSGWVIGEAAAEEGVDDPIPTVQVESEGEEGWEAEAFWALLARAGYQVWSRPTTRVTGPGIGLRPEPRPGIGI